MKKTAAMPNSPIDDGSVGLLVVPDGRGRLVWGNGVVSLVFLVSGDGPVRLIGMSGRGMVRADAGVRAQRDPRPIVELLSTRGGAFDNRLKLIDTVAGSALRFVEARIWEPADGRRCDAAEAGVPAGGEGVSAAAVRGVGGAGDAYDADDANGMDNADGLDAVRGIGGSDMDVSACPGSGAPVFRLEVTQRDPDGDPCGTPTVVSVFEAFEGVSAVRTFTRLDCRARYPVEAVSSMSLTLPMDVNRAGVGSARIYYGDSAWAVENDWHGAMLRDTVVRDRNLRVHPDESSSRFARRSVSTWSTGEHQPAGILEVGVDDERAAGVLPAASVRRVLVQDPLPFDVGVAGEGDANGSGGTMAEGDGALPGGVFADGSPVDPTSDFERSGFVGPDAPGSDGRGGPEPFSLMWQIEHNGAWEWEVGENVPGLHVTAFGPEYEDHQWFTSLGEGNGFESVPVSFAVCAGGWQDAVAEMSLQRRALRSAKAEELGRFADFERFNAVVVYNDYMNTLFGDPRIERELPLVEGAARAGADVFCIDAGWYDSTDGGWWDMVGEWEPSANRFGGAGLSGLADVVRSHGMGLGLWLEPEVIGVKSPMADRLPKDAFISRHGERVSNSRRYLLDFRSRAVRDHLDRTVDRLVDGLGVVFFKFDYNSIPGVGTDVDAQSVGSGLLESSRAYLDWLDALRRRHPGVMIENCGSGAMRADYAQLSRFDMQSTSDQCDPKVYAAIAAGAGLTILPEQQGNWGYAQQGMDDETAVFTLAAGVLGRLYLSGFIDRMGPSRLALVRDAVALHRHILSRQSRLVPWWPAGLPDFNGNWLVSGLRSIEGTDLTQAYGTTNIVSGSASAPSKTDVDHANSIISGAANAQEITEHIAKNHDTNSDVQCDSYSLIRAQESSDTFTAGGVAQTMSTTTPPVQMLEQPTLFDIPELSGSFDGSTAENSDSALASTQNTAKMVKNLRDNDADSQGFHDIHADHHNSPSHVAPSPSYMTLWRRRGESSIVMPLPQNVNIEQVFPDPDHLDHAPDAGLWGVERIEHGLVRFTAARTDEPSARIYRITPIE